jgi:hypothetical protein
MEIDDQSSPKDHSKEDLSADKLLNHSVSADPIIGGPTPSADQTEEQKLVHIDRKQFASSLTQFSDEANVKHCKNVWIYKELSVIEEGRAYID